MPEGTIEIGKTTCQEAQVTLQTHQLRLVDTEYLEIFDSGLELLVDEPPQQLVAIQALSYELSATRWGIGLGSTQKSSYIKKKPRPRAGIILCGLFRQPIFDEE